jgi:geranylgeranyl diphosphate synthase type 3
MSSSSTTKQNQQLPLPPPIRPSSMYQTYLRRTSPRRALPVVEIQIEQPTKPGKGVVISMLPDFIKKREEGLKHLDKNHAPYFKTVVINRMGGKLSTKWPEPLDDGDMLRFRGAGITGNTPERATTEFLSKPLVPPSYVSKSTSNGLGEANIPRSEQEQRNQSVRVAVHKHKIPFFERLGHDAAYLRANKLPTFVIENPYTLLHVSDMYEFSKSAMVYETRDPDALPPKSPIKKMMIAPTATTNTSPSTTTTTSITNTIPAAMLPSPPTQFIKSPFFGDHSTNTTTTTNTKQQQHQQPPQPRSSGPILPIIPAAQIEDVERFLERKYGLIELQDDDDYLSPRWNMKSGRGGGANHHHHNSNNGNGNLNINNGDYFPSPNGFSQDIRSASRSDSLYALWGGQSLTPKPGRAGGNTFSRNNSKDDGLDKVAGGGGGGGAGASSRPNRFSLDTSDSEDGSLDVAGTARSSSINNNNNNNNNGEQHQQNNRLQRQLTGAIYGLPFPSVTDLGYIHDPDSESLLPWRYLMAIPGKNVRDGLIDAFNIWLQVDAPVLAELKDIVGYLHTASLMVDDIEDGSITRRGIPCAHRVFGVDNVINSANYVYMLALQKTLGLQSPRCVEIFTQEMLNLHRGQGRDIWWRNQERVPTQDEYIDMVVDKTGGLFRMAIRMMGALSPRLKGGVENVFRISQNIRETIAECESVLPYETLSNLLGAYFQIRDDVLNLASPEFHKTKGFCDDVQEGKLSFPLIHCIETLRAQEMCGYGAAAHFRLVLREILNQRSHDVRMKKLALRIICLTSSVEYTIWRLDLLAKRILDIISDLGGNPPLSGLINTLHWDLRDCANCLNRVVYVKDHVKVA